MLPEEKMDYNLSIPARQSSRRPASGYRLLGHAPSNRAKIRFEWHPPGCHTRSRDPSSSFLDAVAVVVLLWTTPEVIKQPDERTARSPVPPVQLAVVAGRRTVVPWDVTEPPMPATRRPEPGARRRRSRRSTLCRAREPLRRHQQKVGGGIWLTGWKSDGARCRSPVALDGTEPRLRKPVQVSSGLPPRTESPRSACRPCRLGPSSRHEDRSPGSQILTAEAERAEHTRARAVP